MSDEPNKEQTSDAQQQEVTELTEGQLDEVAGATGLHAGTSDAQSYANADEALDGSLIASSDGSDTNTYRINRIPFGFPPTADDD